MVQNSYRWHQWLNPTPLHVAGARIIGAWEDKDSLSLIMINNCLENTIVSHVQSHTPAHLAWQELLKLSESHDDVTKIYMKDKLHTLKMKENESVAKHIHIVHSRFSNS